MEINEWRWMPADCWQRQGLHVPSKHKIWGTRQPLSLYCFSAFFIRKHFWFSFFFILSQNINENVIACIALDLDARKNCQVVKNVCSLINRYYRCSLKRFVSFHISLLIVLVLDGTCSHVKKCAYCFQFQFPSVQLLDFSYLLIWQWNYEIIYRLNAVQRGSIQLNSSAQSFLCLAGMELWNSQIISKAIFWGYLSMDWHSNGRTFHTKENIFVCHQFSLRIQREQTNSDGTMTANRMRKMENCTFVYTFSIILCFASVRNDNTQIVFLFSRCFCWFINSSACWFYMATNW